MTSRFSRPTLLALAVSLGTLTAGTANAAEPEDLLPTLRGVLGG